MIFSIIVGFLLGLSQLVRPDRIEDVLESGRDPETWVNLFFVLLFTVPFFLGAHGLQDWFGVIAGDLPSSSFDAWSLKFYLVPYVAGELIGEALKHRFRLRDIYNWILPARLDRRSAILIEAASLLYGDQVPDARLQAALLNETPLSKAKTVRAYTAVLAGEILSIDDLALQRLARDLSWPAREDFFASLCRIGKGLNAIGVDELPWIRLIGVQMGMEPNRISELLRGFGFKGMDSGDWTKRWGGTRQSTRAGAWADKTREQAQAQSQGFKGRAGAGGSWGGQSSYYSVLGLAPGANAKDIKMAYRKLAKRYHPDRFVKAHPEAQAKAESHMKAINVAYDALKRQARATA